MTDGSIAGVTSRGFERVADAFADAFTGRPDMGAALSVYVDGNPVVDLWGGVADARSNTPWNEDTLSVIFSCTKGLMSILAARLVQEGRLDYDTPVTQYWPEFAANGKGGTRVRDLLAHKAGLSAPRHDLSTADIADWDVVTRALAEQQPFWEPGTAWNYHTITHGWLIGEVIRRITGDSVGAFFAETLARPLDASAWIGLPDRELGRVAHLRVGTTLAELTDKQRSALTPGVTDWLWQAMTLGNALPPELVSADRGFNDPALQQAQIPGAGGIATARALAGIWSSTVTPTRGVRSLDDAVLDLALQPQTFGGPFFTSPPPYPRWGVGFQLDSEARRYLGGSSFGHDGAGGQVAFADRDHRVGFAFLTNEMEAVDPRGTALVDALRATLEA